MKTTQAVATALLIVTTTGGLSAQQGSAKAPGRDQYPHASEPIGTVRQVYDGILTPEMAVNTFRNIDRLFPTRTVPRASKPMPLPPAATPLTTVSVIDCGKNYDLEDYLRLNRLAAILVLKSGRVTLQRYLLGNSERTR